MMDLIKVNFIGIGGQKCASTWIYDILLGHPDVCLSDEKEIDFFSNYWDRGFAWYASYFDEGRARKARVVGEVSPSYLSDSDAPERAAKYNKDMKIILTLRDPVDRAYSNHKHNIRQGFVLDNDLAFEVAMSRNPTYVEHGFYGKSLRAWMSCFPRNQILVIFFEDIVSRPFEVAKELYSFLGIAVDYQSAFLNKKSNESVAVANVGVAKKIDRIRNLVRSSSFSWLWDILCAVGVRSLYRAINMREVESAIPKMLPETRCRLRELYREDIAMVEALTGRSLNEWKGK